MAIGATRDALSRIFFQRCFYLFVLLPVLIAAVSFLPARDRGRLRIIESPCSWRYSLPAWRGSIPHEAVTPTKGPPKAP
jgi:hypothetical protein